MLKSWGVLFKAAMALAVRRSVDPKTVTRHVEERWAKCGVGRELWVRETWAEVHPCVVAEGRYSQPARAGIPGPPPVSYRVIYRADGPYPGHTYAEGWPYRRALRDGEIPDAGRGLYRGDVWESSMLMPRIFTRTTLRTVSVTREDWTPSTRIDDDEARREGFASADEFHALWSAMHPDYTGPVWRIESERVDA